MYAGIRFSDGKGINFEQVAEQYQAAGKQEEGVDDRFALGAEPFAGSQAAEQRQKDRQGGRVKLQAFVPVSFAQGQQGTLEAASRAVVTGQVFERTGQKKPVRLIR